MPVLAAGAEGGSDLLGLGLEARKTLGLIGGVEPDEDDVDRYVSTSPARDVGDLACRLEAGERVAGLSLRKIGVFHDGFDAWPAVVILAGVVGQAEQHKPICQAGA